MRVSCRGSAVGTHGRRGHITIAVTFLPTPGDLLRYHKHVSILINFRKCDRLKALDIKIKRARFNILIKILNDGKIFLYTIIRAITHCHKFYNINHNYISKRIQLLRELIACNYTIQWSQIAFNWFLWSHR